MSNPKCWTVPFKMTADFSRCGLFSSVQTCVREERFAWWMHARNIRRTFPLLTPHSCFHQSGFLTRFLQPFFFFNAAVSCNTTLLCSCVCALMWIANSAAFASECSLGLQFPTAEGSVSRLCEKSFDTSATICGFKFVLVTKWPCGKTIWQIVRSAAEFILFPLDMWMV